ncbi:MAG: cell division protein ZapA [Thermodesulfovibrionales bacterium]|nr:cell division protein ZapA [Thermodesulfovibrionales bacterium]
MTNTEVYILGQKYTIKGDASEEHIKELSRYIDEKIQEVLSAAPTVSPLKALILTSFSIAEEIYKLRAEQEDIAKGMEEKTAELTSLFF